MLFRVISLGSFRLLFRVAAGVVACCVVSVAGAVLVSAAGFVLIAASGAATVVAVAGWLSDCSVAICGPYALQIKKFNCRQIPSKT